jgi:hypothetical protein
MKHAEPYKTITFSDPDSDPSGGAGAVADGTAVDQIAERDKLLLAPILYVRVHGPSMTLPLEAVVDSGASRSLFSCAVLETLGYRREDLEESYIQSGSGVTKQYMATDESMLRVEIPAIDHSLHVTPAFLEGLEGGLMLLGRTDFFRQFLVTFDQRASTFWLERYEDAPSSPPP